MANAHMCGDHIANVCLHSTTILLQVSALMSTDDVMTFFYKKSLNRKGSSLKIKEPVP